MANRALVLGFQQTRNPRFSKLSSIENNVQLFHDLLRIPTDGDPLYDQVDVGIDLAAADADRKINNFCADADAEDCILIVISGHGERVGGITEDLLIVTPDLDDNDRYTKLILRESILVHIVGSRAKQKCIILDCCHSGVVANLIDPQIQAMRADLIHSAIGADRLLSQLEQTGGLQSNIIVVASSAADEAAFEVEPGDIWEALRRRLVETEFFRNAVYLRNANQHFSIFVLTLAQTLLFEDYLPKDAITTLSKNQDIQSTINTLERDSEELRGNDDGIVTLVTLFDVSQKLLPFGPTRQTPLLAGRNAAKTFPLFQHHRPSRKKYLRQLRDRASSVTQASPRTRALLTDMIDEHTQSEYAQLLPSQKILEKTLLSAMENCSADFVFVETILSYEHSGVVAKELEAQKLLLAQERGTLEQRLSGSIRENEELQKEFKIEIDKLRAEMKTSIDPEIAKLRADMSTFIGPMSRMIGRHNAYIFGLYFVLLLLGVLLAVLVVSH
jgi:Caspase domain